MLNENIIDVSRSGDQPKLFKTGALWRLLLRGDEGKEIESKPEIPSVFFGSPIILLTTFYSR